MLSLRCLALSFQMQQHKRWWMVLRIKSDTAPKKA
jgi:hypothetical protein